MSAFLCGHYIDAQRLAAKAATGADAQLYQRCAYDIMSAEGRGHYIYAQRLAAKAATGS